MDYSEMCYQITCTSCLREVVDNICNQRSIRKEEKFGENPEYHVRQTLLGGTWEPLSMG